MDNALYQNKPREIDPYQEWAGQTDFNRYFDYNKANAEINAQTQEAQPQPIYQPAVDNTATKYNEFNSQMNTQEAASTPATPPAPEQVWDEITSPFPEPKYDDKRQQRLKNIAKANALGKGLSALGDIFSLSQGALVNKRENDGRIDRYNAMYQQYEDDYNRRMDQHNRDKINMYLQQLRDKRSEDWRNKSWNFQTDQAAKNEEWRKEQNRITQENRKEDKTESRERWEKSVEMQDIDNKRQQEYQDWQMNKYAEEKALKDLEAKNTANGVGKAFDIFTSNGKKIQIDGENERNNILKLIMEDTSIPSTDIDLLKPKMGQPMSTNAINMLVQKYWERSPLATAYINQKYGATKEPEKAGNEWLKGLGVKTDTNFPYAPQQQQSKSTSTSSDVQIDYTNINY